MEKFISDLTDQIRAMTQINLITIGLAVICYIPLWTAIATSKDEQTGTKNGAGQNFYTWMLWLILDFIQFTCTFLEHGTYVHFLAFIPCATLTTILVLKYRKKIDCFEIFIALFIVFCIFIWLTVDRKQAIIFETVCQVVAGFPLLRDSWRKPEEFLKTLIPLSCFMALYILILCTIPEFSVKHALFPMALLIYSFLSFLFILRGLKLKNV